MRLRLPGRSRDETGPHRGRRPARRLRTRPSAEPGAEATAAPAPPEGRGPKLQRASRTLAIASAQFLLIAAAVVVLFWVLGKLWSILLPIVLGLLIATVLWPATRFLRKHRLAAGAGRLDGAAGRRRGLRRHHRGDRAVGGRPGHRARRRRDQRHCRTSRSGCRARRSTSARTRSATRSTRSINSIQDNAQNIAGYALTGVSAVGNSLLNLVLALVLVFFFLKDGPRFVPWLSAQTGPRAARHVAALSYKSWDTLSEFIRQQALVGFIDAFFIGLGLWILGVPLVIPLAVLTFFGGFIPIIGAFVAGAFAVLVALVSNGFTTALIVLGIVLARAADRGQRPAADHPGPRLQPARRRGHPRRHRGQQPGRDHRRLPQRADRRAASP